MYPHVVMKDKPCSLNLAINDSNGIMLVESVELADTAMKRFRGLIGRKELTDGRAMVLMPCCSVHTCFMRFDLDLVFFSRDFRVVRMVRNVRPWRVVRGGSRAWGVLEARSGWLPPDRPAEGELLKLTDRRVSA